MQREIEFRAWNKEEKKMYYDAQDAYDYLGDFPATSFGSILKYPDIWHVMQFTGIHDKNGKKIHEEDIVRKWCGDEDFCKRNMMTGTVEWGNAGFVCTTHDKEIEVKGGIKDKTMQKMGEVHLWIGMHSCLRDRYLEVIGNIWETPSLLII